MEITTPDGTMDVSIMLPRGTIDHDRSWPVVIMFSDIGGIRAATEEKAQCIADMGYAVLLPNIFYRSRSGSLVPNGKRFEDQDVLPVLIEYGKRLTPDALSKDFAALIRTIDNKPEFRSDRIGTVGYCRGGGIAVRFAALHPERIVAVAGIHSSRLADVDDPNSPMLVASRIKAKVYLGHADSDPYLPADQIIRLDKILADADVKFITEVYHGAAHGFSISDAQAYDPTADSIHYSKLEKLFNETMGM